MILCYNFEDDEKAHGFFKDIANRMHHHTNIKFAIGSVSIVKTHDEHFAIIHIQSFALFFPEFLVKLAFWFGMRKQGVRSKIMKISMHDMMYIILYQKNKITMI